MHVDGEYYEKKKLAPLYSGNDKKIVIGGTLGLSQRSNVLLRIFRASIAPQAGNIDAIRGGLVNLLAYSHEVYCKGETAEIEPLDVMDYIHKEMYDCIVNKKTPLYAPFIMKLILAQHLNHPLLKANLKEHKIVKLQRKAPTGHSNEPFAPLRGEGGYEIEEGLSTRRGPRMKHASNDGSSSKNKFVQEYKRLNWFQRNVLCMNVDIRHKQYDSYVAQKHMNENQQALHKAFQASCPGYVESTPSSSSSGTHSYGKWSKGLADWQAFEEVTSHPSGTENVAQGKKPMGPEDNEDDDEDYNSGFEDDAEDEDEE
jgi:hypothetical protein